MGEFTEQMMGAGADLVAMTDVLGMIPGLANDLNAGADAVAATAAISRCKAREIPEPHRTYGHLLFGVAMHHPISARVDAIRSIANVVGAAHRAPAFGSACGDVPTTEIARAITACGFVRTAELWLAAEAAERAIVASQTSTALVWEVPTVSIQDRTDPNRRPEHAAACVGVLDGGYFAVDFASFGERVTRSRPLYAMIPGVTFFASEFDREFERKLDWRTKKFAMSPRGEERLCALLTAHCGAPRAPRILAVDQ